MCIIKVSVWLDMEVELRMQLCRDFFRPIRRFYVDWSFWRDDFENRFFLNYLMTATKNVTKILQKTNQLLRDMFENKNEL